MALLGHPQPKDLAAHQRRDKVQAEYPLDWLSWQVEEGLVFACVADETGVVLDRLPNQGRDVLDQPCREPSLAQEDLWDAAT